MKTILLNSDENSGNLGVFSTSKNSLKSTFKVYKVVFINLLILTFLSINIDDAFADGSRDLIKSTDVTGDLTTSNEVGICLFNFADGDGTIGTPEAIDSKRRYYVRIKDPINERIYLGFNIGLMRNNSRTIYFRVLTPDGDTVIRDWTAISNSGQGYIDNFYQAFNGPDALLDSNTAPFVTGPNSNTGYDPFVVEFNRGTNGYYPAGDYIIEFNNRISNTIANSHNNHQETVIFRMFDISVGKEINGNNEYQAGRFYGYIFSLYNYFTTLGFNQIDVEYYAYQETDMVMSKLKWDNVVGGGWNILFNTNGAGSTGDLRVDRMSNPSSAPTATDALPQYMVFFAPPDTSVFPVLDLAPEFEYLDFRRDCLTGENAFYFEMNRSGTIEIILEFDSIYTNGVYDPGTTDTLLVFDDVTINTNKAIWDGKDGQGTYRLSNDPNNTDTFYITFRYSIGVINNPIFDVERVNGGLSVVLYAPILPNWDTTRNVFWDDRNVTASSYSSSFNYTGCMSGCHVYPDSPSSNSTSTPHPGNQIWMNSWWSSYDMVTTSPFTNYPKIDTIPFTVTPIASSDCEINDGALQIEGLVGGDSYYIDYYFGSYHYGPVLHIADNNGMVILSGLESGIYTDIIVDQQNYCDESKVAYAEIPCPYNIYGNVVQDNDGVMLDLPYEDPAFGYLYIDGPGIGVAGIYNDTLFVILYEITPAKGYDYIKYEKVNLDGTYKFTDVEANTNYLVCLTSEDLRFSTPTQLETKYQDLTTPDDWFFIGEVHDTNTGITYGRDSIVDGILQLKHQLSDSKTNAKNVNFAIDDDNTLPIKLLSFNAFCNNDNINIMWETASEINNDYFTIEKSYDMINWETVDVVQGSGNSNQINSYNTIDDKNNQLVYYRLIQTDFDGKYVVYTPINLNVCNNIINNYSVDVFPNPSINTVNIRVNNYQYYNAILNVYNAVGQNVYKHEMNKANISINVSKWERGIYFIRLNIDDEIIMNKIILD